MTASWATRPSAGAGMKVSNGSKALIQQGRLLSRAGSATVDDIDHSCGPRSARLRRRRVQYSPITRAFHSIRSNAPPTPFYRMIQDIIESTGEPPTPMASSADPRCAACRGVREERWRPGDLVRPSASHAFRECRQKEPVLRPSSRVTRTRPPSSGLETGNHLPRRRPRSPGRRRPWPRALRTPPGPRLIDGCIADEEIRLRVLFEPGSLLPLTLPRAVQWDQRVRVQSTNPLILLAPRAGLEPATKRLTVQLL